MTRTAVSEAHTRRRHARATLAELEKSKQRYVELYRATRDKRYELKAWLLDDGIGQAREAVRRAEAEVEGG